MDELVFLRETLRRALLETIDKLDEAAANYDPEVDVPMQDLAAAVMIDITVGHAGRYCQMVVHRIKDRAKP